MMRGRLTDDDRDLVGSIWETYRPFVESVARRHLGDRPEDVPDVVQSVALSLCRGLNGYRGAGQIRAWLGRITVREARMARRSAERRTRLLDSVAFEGDSIRHDSDSRRVSCLAVREAIQQLTPPQRSILRQDLDGSSISMSEAAWAMRYRARKSLRSLLSADPRTNR